MARPRTGRRHMASLPRDDSQGRTSGILGICRKSPRTEDQTKILTLKTDQKQAENSQKPSENRSKTTPIARRRLKMLPPKSASEVPDDGEDQRYPEATLNKQQNSQNVKNPDKNRTKQRPASPERRARCFSRPPEMETQAAPHVGSSPEAPTRAIGTFGSSK